MRWTQPSEGDIRERSGFLWWPLTIKKETRWLEFARWQEQRSAYGYWRTLTWVKE